MEPQLNPEQALNNFIEQTTAAMAKAGGQDAPTPPPPAQPQQPPPSPQAPPTAPDTKPTTDDANVAPVEPKEGEPVKAQHWKALKAEHAKHLKERDDKITELTTQIAGLSEQIKGATSGKELETLKKERDELSEKIALLNVVEHPKFKQFFDSRRQQQLQIAKGILGDKAAEFEQIAKLPDGTHRDKLFEDLVSGLDSVIAQGRVANVINQLAAIDVERAAEVEKWKSNKERIDAEEAASRQQAETARQQAQEKLFKDFEAELAKAAQDNPAFKKRENDEAWNTGITQRLDFAKALFAGKVDRPTLFKSVINAAAFDGVVSHNLAQAKEIERLNEVIKGMEAATPTVRSGGGQQTAGDFEIKPGMTPQQAMEAFTRRLSHQMQGQ